MNTNTINCGAYRITGVKLSTESERVTYFLDRIEGKCLNNIMSGSLDDCYRELERQRKQHDA